MLFGPRCFVFEPRGNKWPNTLRHFFWWIVAGAQLLLSGNSIRFSAQQV